jgi:chromate reductase, NAD(P)H dehydrogenase (quinone)
LTRVTTILGLGGSLREGSWNKGLLRAAVDLAPKQTQIDLSQLGALGQLPHFDQSMEADPPAAVEELKARLRTADGLLIATPEYNNGIPGFLKNAIDWVSRPNSDIPAVFGDLPVALIGAGGFSGTRFAQAGWVHVCRYLKMRPWSGHTLYAAQAWALFDKGGRLTDEATKEQLRAVVEGFARYCANVPRSRMT